MKPCRRQIISLRASRSFEEFVPGCCSNRTAKKKLASVSLRTIGRQRTHRLRRPDAPRIEIELSHRAVIPELPTGTSWSKILPSHFPSRSASTSILPFQLLTLSEICNDLVAPGAR